MKTLNPEQWRTLNYLHQHKLHTVRPKLTHVCKAQNVTDDDLDRLAEARYISADIGMTELDLHVGLHKLGKVLQRAIRLRLAPAGLWLVMEDPGNQIRYTLGQHPGPISVNKLFDGNTISMDDLVTEEARGRCKLTLTLPDGSDLDVPAEALWLFYEGRQYGELFKIALTAKARTYLPF